MGRNIPGYKPRLFYTGVIPGILMSGFYTLILGFYVFVFRVEVCLGVAQWFEQTTCYKYPQVQFSV